MPDKTQISIPGNSHVAAGIYVHKVEPFLICPTYRIGEALDRIISDDFPNTLIFKVARAEVSDGELKTFSQCPVVGNGHGLRTKQGTQFYFIDRQVAADANRHKRFSAINFVNKHFNCFVRRYFKKGRYFLNTFLIRGCNFLHWLGIGWDNRLPRSIFGKGFFDIGRIIARTAKGDGIFARISQYVEFMGNTASDVPGIGLDRPEIKTAAFENGRVSVMHDPVHFVKRCLVGMERIRVFHDEFTSAHQAVTRADFVPELRLYLIQAHGQVAVRPYRFSDYIHDHFLVRGSQTEIIAFSVCQAQKFRAVIIPSAAFLPEFRRNDHGHEQLRGIAPQHFAAYDVLDFTYDPEPGRQIVVNP